MTDITDEYTALIGTSAGTVTGDYCDVVVIKEAWGVDPEFRTNLPVRVDDDDVLIKVTDAADRALENAGWMRIDEWECETDGFRATVTRA